MAASPTSFIVLPNGVQYVFQEDGNFVAYRDGKPVAATASNSRGDNLFLVFQEDGNLVVYNNGRALWASQTGGIARGADLVLRESSPFIQIIGKDGFVYYTGNEKGRL